MRPIEDRSLEASGRRRAVRLLRQMPAAAAAAAAGHLAEPRHGPAEVLARGAVEEEVDGEVGVEEQSEGLLQRVENDVLVARVAALGAGRERRGLSAGRRAWAGGKKGDDKEEKD